VKGYFDPAGLVPFSTGLHCSISSRWRHDERRRGKAGIRCRDGNRYGDGDGQPRRRHWESCRGGVQRRCEDSGDCGCCLSRGQPQFGNHTGVTIEHLTRWPISHFVAKERQPLLHVGHLSRSVNGFRPCSGDRACLRHFRSLSIGYIDTRKPRRGRELIPKLPDRRAGPNRCRTGAHRPHLLNDTAQRRANHHHRGRTTRTVAAGSFIPR
jgi:hypothetical protein